MTVKWVVAGLLFLMGLGIGWKTTSMYYQNKSYTTLIKDSKADFQKAEKLEALLQEYRTRVPEIKTRILRETSLLSPSCRISDDGLRALQDLAGYTTSQSDK